MRSKKGAAGVMAVVVASAVVGMPLLATAAAAGGVAAWALHPVSSTFKGEIEEGETLEYRFKELGERYNAVVNGSEWFYQRESKRQVNKLFSWVLSEIGRHSEKVGINIMNLNHGMKVAIGSSNSCRTVGQIFETRDKMITKIESLIKLFNLDRTFKLLIENVDEDVEKLTQFSKLTIESFLSVATSGQDQKHISSMDDTLSVMNMASLFSFSNIRRRILSKQYIFQMQKSKDDQFQRDIKSEHKVNIVKTQFVIKFLKNRQRMLLCKEKDAFLTPLENLVKNDVMAVIGDAEAIKSMTDTISTMHKTIECKFHDVDEEFNLSEEIKYAAHALQIYTRKSMYLTDDYSMRIFIPGNWSTHLCSDILKMPYHQIQDVKQTLIDSMRTYDWKHKNANNLLIKPKNIIEGVDTAVRVTKMGGGRRPGIKRAAANVRTGGGVYIGSTPILNPPHPAPGTSFPKNTKLYANHPDSTMKELGITKAMHDKFFDTHINDGHPSEHEDSVVQEFAPGVTLNNLHKLQIGKNDDKRAVAAGPDLMRCLIAFVKFVIVFLGEMIRTGKFHADPHPGNILMSIDSDINMIQLSLIDFGDFKIIPDTMWLIVKLVLGYTCEYFQINDSDSRITMLSNSHMIKDFIAACVANHESVSKAEEALVGLTGTFSRNNSKFLHDIAMSFILDPQNILKVFGVASGFDTKKECAVLDSSLQLAAFVVSFKKYKKGGRDDNGTKLWTNLSNEILKDVKGGKFGAFLQDKERLHNVLYEEPSKCNYDKVDADYDGKLLNLVLDLDRVIFALIKLFNSFTKIVDALLSKSSPPSDFSKKLSTLICGDESLQKYIHLLNDPAYKNIIWHALQAEPIELINLVNAISDVHALLSSIDKEDMHAKQVNLTKRMHKFPLIKTDMTFNNAIRTQVNDTLKVRDLVDIRSSNYTRDPLFGFSRKDIRMSDNNLREYENKEVDLKSAADAKRANGFKSKGDDLYGDSPHV
jgi:hypothetical protein